MLMILCQRGYKQCWKLKYQGAGQERFQTHTKSNSFFCNKIPHQSSLQDIITWNTQPLTFCVKRLLIALTKYTPSILKDAWFKDFNVTIASVYPPQSPGQHNSLICWWRFYLSNLFRGGFLNIDRHFRSVVYF